MPSLGRSNAASSGPHAPTRCWGVHSHPAWCCEQTLGGHLVRDRHLFCVPDRRPVSLGQLGARVARLSTCPVICALLDFLFVSCKFNKQRLHTAYCSPLSAVCHADVNTSVLAGAHKAERGARYCSAHGVSQCTLVYIAMRHVVNSCVARNADIGGRTTLSSSPEAAESARRTQRGSLFALRASN